MRYLIVMDGPVDTYWIENLNSVLDENKKLCLSNGQVLIFTEYITILFEIDHLRMASPAIVTRCAQIYMD